MGRRRVLAWILVAVSLLLPAFVWRGASAADATPITVYAAASLTDALETLGARWREKTGTEVKFSFAASSTLARQIESGAPAAIFASADEAWMDYLAERKLIVDDTRVSPIGNRLVLVAPSDSPITSVELVPNFPLATLLGDGRLSTGDPAHVPVGRYSEQALTALGVWPVAEPRLARAESVRAALVLVERGETPLGIVYTTDALQSKAVRVVGTFPEDSHKPITYPMAIIEREDGPAARLLFSFLTGPEAKAVYASYGFITPSQ
ncbi:MAG: molybdate ABC transporter substrate-binding protein [Rhodospirillales bacterium]